MDGVEWVEWMEEADVPSAASLVSLTRPMISVLYVTHVISRHLCHITWTTPSHHIAQIPCLSLGGGARVCTRPDAHPLESMIA